MLLLRELQRSLKNAILKKDETHLVYILANGLSISARLQIYRNNFFIHLTEALKNIYPAIYRLVGEDFFIAAAKKYIDQYPLNSGNLHTFGGYFADFLANFSPAKQIYYLSEMAQLEWAYHEAFYAEDSSLFDITKFTIIPEDNYGKIIFKLHPSSRLFAFQFPILSIWQICQQESDEEIKIVDKEEKILVIRRQWDVAFEKLTESEFSFLMLFHDGVSFEKACESVLDIDSGFNINECLQKHVLLGTIVNLSVV